MDDGRWMPDATRPHRTTRDAMRETTRGRFNAPTRSPVAVAVAVAARALSPVPRVAVRRFASRNATTS